jgi:hypothetical protein
MPARGFAVLRKPQTVQGWIGFSGGDGHHLPASPPAEKATASHHQTWQSGAHDRTRNTGGKAG